MWSKRLTRTVMVGMAVLVWSTSVAAQECQRPPAKIAALVAKPANTFIYMFCDKVKTPACTVQFFCDNPGVKDEDPVTWDESVEPGTLRPIGRNGRNSFLQKLSRAGSGLSIPGPPGYTVACVVRSNDPVEVTARELSGGEWRTVAYRISPPEPYPCPSSNAALSGLTVSGGGTLAPSFDSDTTEYTFTTRATRVAFTPTAADSEATIRVYNAAVQSGTASGNFGVPWTRLPITVTAEDGTTTRTYYVTTRPRP